jgi:hypothetical protein
MSMGADRLAEQVKLAYEFMDALHGQAIALIKDVEVQLIESTEELQCIRPGGYKYTVNPQSSGLERPQPTMADYYAVYFKRFTDRIKNTSLDAKVPPIAFLKVVLREPRLENPEVRFGIMTEITKPPDRANRHPRKFEDIISYPLTSRAIVGPAWSGRDQITQAYEHGYIRLTIHGAGVGLAALPDSEAIAREIVEPLSALYREAAG